MRLLRAIEKETTIVIKTEVVSVGTSVKKIEVETEIGTGNTTKIVVVVANLLVGMVVPFSLCSPSDPDSSKRSRVRSPSSPRRPVSPPSRSHPTTGNGNGNGNGSSNNSGNAASREKERSRRSPSPRHSSPRRRSNPRRRSRSRSRSHSNPHSSSHNISRAE